MKTGQRLLKTEMTTGLQKIKSNQEQQKTDITTGLQKMEEKILQL